MIQVGPSGNPGVLIREGGTRTSGVLEGNVINERGREGERMGDWKMEDPISLALGTGRDRARRKSLP